MKESEQTRRTRGCPRVYVMCGLTVIFVALYGVFYKLLTQDPSATMNVDLAAFYAGSVQAFTKGLSPYDVAALQPIRGDGVLTPPYIYPPTSLFVFYPLSFFTWSGAQQFMWSVNVVLVGIIAWVLPSSLCRIDMGQRFVMATLCLIGTMLFGPMIVTIQVGQINLVLLLSLVAFWVFSRARKALVASVFLLIAILCKTYPIVLLPLLLSIGKKREVAYTCSFVLVAAALSFVILPHGLWSQWILQIAPSGAYTHAPEGLHQPSAIWNQSLNGIFCRLFTENEWSVPLVASPRLAQICIYGAVGLVLLLSSWGVWRCRRYSNALDRMMIIALPSLYLVAPLSWEHHLVYVLPIVLLLFTSETQWTFSGNVAFRGIVMILWVLLALPELLAIKGFTVIALWALSLFVATREGAFANPRA